LAVVVVPQQPSFGRLIIMLYKQHLSYVQAETEKALAARGYDGLWIYSGHPVNYFLDDMPPPQAINPHFKWWVPAAHVSSSVVHIRSGHKPRLYLYQPADFWHSVEDLTGEKWTAYFDVVVLKDYRDLPDFSAESNHAWIGSAELQPLPAEHTNPATLLNHIHHARVTKTPYEIHCVQKANQIALRGHAAAKDAFDQGQSEFEAHLAYMQATGQSEAELPYGNIVAYNNNASILHYQYQQTVRPDAAERRSFLIDAGANYRGYAADVTRTYSANGGEFAEMIQSMDVIQQELCAGCTVGSDYVALHRQAHLSISNLLQEHDVLKCDAEEAVESGLSGTFYPHGLGHFIGLQVHDIHGHILDASGTKKTPPELFPFLRLTHQLDEHMVLTIEPGLYFIPMLLAQVADDQRINWQKVEALKPFGGIRIEDDVCVTANGPVNLTRTETLLF